ncbi:hypothetical protein MTBBW1_2130091 [Desulfamplus magnetovallimortis]|uniref:Uncharacterized protein n=1 Tax=Desulfamplus magnetovallimortis TaxID=1246637 RepID=A0A1W1HCN3_9BACT|nr:hypothetical protein [Desulfamplus magnetovallimortis]SLM30196.1 hypothetical protein MTBBW1_2130091 [Desulfamplus magnetovallimortis]
MTDDGIDVEKLTSDAFMAIDALFTDDDEDDDDLFGGEAEVEKELPSDLDRIEEYMLAMEWEYSDKEVNRFNDFLTEISSQYSDRHSQDILKMISSIVRYIMKAREKTLPETHHVLEAVVKTFKDIQLNDLDDETIRLEKKATYNKVLALKKRIARFNAENQITVDERQEKASKPSHLDKSQPSSHLPVETVSEPAVAVSNKLTDESSIIRGIDEKFLEYENRVQAIESSNEKLKQLFATEQKQRQALEDKIEALESRIEELLESVASISKSASLHAGPSEPSKSDASHELDLDEMDFATVVDDIEIADTTLSKTSAAPALGTTGQEDNNFHEVSPDQVDFEEISSDETLFDSQDLERMAPEDTQFNELASDSVQFDEVDPDSVQLGEVYPDSVQFDEVDPDSVQFDEVDPDSVQFDEVDPDSVQFDEVDPDSVQFDEVDPDSVQFDEVDPDSVQFDEVDPDSVKFDEAAPDKTLAQKSSAVNEIGLASETYDQETFEGSADSVSSVDVLSIDDIEYDEITVDDIEYASENDVEPLAGDKNRNNVDDKEVVYEDTAAVNGVLNKKSSESQVAYNNDGTLTDSSEELSSDGDGWNLEADESKDSEEDKIKDNFVRCFTLDERLFAMPADMINNVYKIPSKVLNKIEKEDAIILGDFASFFKKLSTNMSGAMADKEESELKSMMVGVRRLKDTPVKYKQAVLCSADNQVWVIPVTGVYDDALHQVMGMDNARNEFSALNVDIDGIGTIPLVSQE